MTALSATHPGRRTSRPAGSVISLQALQRGLLWLLMAVSSLAVIEPAPYDVLFVGMLILFGIIGLRLSRPLFPLILLLLLFNVGGVFALIPFIDEPVSSRFIAISIYLMLSAFFFAAIMAEDAERRLEAMLGGMMVAAWISAIAGIAGYFNIAGLQEFFTLNERASGTFKDANVFGPFMVLPVAHVAHQVLTGRMGALRGLMLVSLPVFGVFLSFSRGAWGNLIGALLLLVALTFLTSATARLRLRVLIVTGTGLFVVVAALLIALAFEGIREMFTMRASLEQSYDLGEMGRFGNQLRSLPLLLDAPNGLGPLRFRKYFPEDPHNVYINAFASYGWLGGFSYLALTVVTAMAGWSLVFRRTALQPYTIVIWSVLFVTILQGLQIDTDHWRHFYLMLGLIWGLAAQHVAGFARAAPPPFRSPRS